MTVKIENFEIKCLKCNSKEVIIETEPSIDYGGYTGVQSGSFVIKCKSCGNAQTEYT